MLVDFLYISSQEIGSFLPGYFCRMQKKLKKKNDEMKNGFLWATRFLTCLQKEHVSSGKSQ
jgi:hypothetical protein